MPKQSTLRKIALAIAFGTSAALLTAASAGAHGHGGGSNHSGGNSGGFVNTIHPIVRSPIVNTIHPIVRGPIINTIHPIVRDHRTGVYGLRCRTYGTYYGNAFCSGGGGLPYGTKPAQLPYGYQLPQGGQVRDHRS